MDFLLWLEQSGFSTWVREGGSTWGYPFILFMHTLGLGTLAGVSGAVNLRVLGFAPNIPLAPLKRLFPLMWLAFAVTAVSGTALLVADATTKLASPVFYVKMVFVALAVVNLQLIKRQVFTDRAGDMPLAPNGRLLAVTSLLLWMAATTSGRLMAYLGPVSGLD
jgi:uncharacterized membrane protein